MELSGVNLIRIKFDNKDEDQVLFEYDLFQMIPFMSETDGFVGFYSFFFLMYSMHLIF